MLGLKSSKHCRQFSGRTISTSKHVYARTSDLQPSFSSPLISIFNYDSMPVTLDDNQLKIINTTVVTGAFTENLPPTFKVKGPDNHDKKKNKEVDADENETTKKLKEKQIGNAISNRVRNSGQPE